MLFSDILLLILNSKHNQQIQSTTTTMINDNIKTKNVRLSVFLDMILIVFISYSLEGFFLGVIAATITNYQTFIILA